MFFAETERNRQKFYRSMQLNDLECTPWTKAGNLQLRSLSYKAVIPNLTDEETSIEEEQRCERTATSFTVTSTLQFPDIDFGGQFLLYTVYRVRDPAGQSETQEHTPPESPSSTHQLSHSSKSLSFTTVSDVCEVIVSIDIKFFQSTTVTIRQGLQEVCLEWLRDVQHEWCSFVQRECGVSKNAL